MSYAKELRELLRPLGLYRVDDGASGAELEAVGAALDGVDGALELAERESCLATAEDGGLSAWESLLPFTPASVTEAERRAAIAALLRIDEASFTLAAIRDTLAGCGIAVTVEETATPLTVEVRFPGHRGIPSGIDGLKSRIEQILPCHLNVSYVYLYLTWAELETLFPRWSAMHARALNWDTLERLGGDAA